jgi:hypothetical protein
MLLVVDSYGNLLNFVIVRMLEIVINIGRFNLPFAHTNSFWHESAIVTLSNEKRRSVTTGTS